LTINLTRDSKVQRSIMFIIWFLCFG